MLSSLVQWQRDRSAIYWDRHPFRSGAEARLAVFEFIEGFYDRCHSALRFPVTVAFKAAKPRLAT